MPETPDQQHAAWLRDAFRSEQSGLLAYAIRTSGGRRDRAEEAVQETFLRLCRETEKANSLRIGEDSSERLRAWLFKVCRSRIIDMQRTDHAPPPARRSGDSADSHFRDRPDPGEQPPDALARCESSEQLRQLVETLPPQQRELLHLKIYGQLSYREMAEATGMSVSSVGFQLHQAMQTLRQKLMPTV